MANTGSEPKLHRLERRTNNLKRKTEYRKAKKAYREAKGPSLLSHVPWWGWTVLLIGLLIVVAAHNGVDMQADGQRAMGALKPLVAIGAVIAFLAWLSGGKKKP